MSDPFQYQDSTSLSGVISAINQLRADAPYRARWMEFVDGENLTARAQQLAKNNNLTLEEGPYYQPDKGVWLPQVHATEDLSVHISPHVRLQPHASRAYYYVSASGDDNKINSITEALWNIGFEPKVFKKRRQEDKAKGVDIALTTDLLSNAYLDNYDVAVLVAGDGDYVPLVDEVKRIGKRVHVVFFEGRGLGLSPSLRLASDWFYRLDNTFISGWGRRNSGE